MSEILLIRFRQLQRMLADLGAIRGLLGIGFILAAYYLLCFSFVTEKNQPVALCISIGICLSIHLSRTDHNFLKLCGIRPFLLCAMEYLILFLPLITANFQQLLYSGGLLLGALLIGIIPVSLKTETKSAIRFVHRLVPTDLFEILSMVRKNLPLYVFSLPLVIFFANTEWMIPIAGLAFAVSLAFSYNFNESLQMLRLFGDSAKRVLLNKIFLALRFFTLAYLPFSLLYVTLYPANWHLALCANIFGCLLISLAIIFKYRLYEPGTEGKTQVLVSINSISLFVPYLVPLPVLMFFIYRRKALTNLKQYFHA